MLPVLLFSCRCRVGATDVDIDADADADVASDADSAVASYTYEPYLCDDSASDHNNMPAT